MQETVALCKLSLHTHCSFPVGTPGVRRTTNGRTTNGRTTNGRTRKARRVPTLTLQAAMTTRRIMMDLRLRGMMTPSACPLANKPGTTRAHTSLFHV